RRPEAGTRQRRTVLLSRRLTHVAALAVLTVNAAKRRYEMCAVPEARPVLSLLAQRAAPSRPLSTWLPPASYRPAACQPIQSLHHVIEDAQRTERTERDIVKAHQTGLPQRELLHNGFRLFRCACVDDEHHPLPVGPEIPLVDLTREI